MNRSGGLIRRGEKPDQLVWIDQNGDGDADEGQEPREVEPIAAGLIAQQQQGEARGYRAKCKQQRRDRRRQRIGRQNGAQSQGRDQRAQQHGGEQFPGPIGGSVGLLQTNPAAVREGHLIALVEVSGIQETCYEMSPADQFILDSLVIMKRPKLQEASGAKPQRPVVPESRQLRKEAGDPRL